MQERQTAAAGPYVFALNRAARIAARGLGAAAGLVLTGGEGCAVAGGSFGFERIGTPSPDDLDALIAAVAGNSGIATAAADAEPLLDGVSFLRGDPGLRFAAGVSVVDADGLPCGAVWVFDRARCASTPDAISFLNDVAPQVAGCLNPTVSEDRARRAETRLTEAVEALADAFVYFDRSGGMVLCNRRFRDLHAGAAHVLRPGARFADILRAGLDAGGYPEAEGREAKWLADRLAAHAEPGPAEERRLPDGRWLRVEEKATGSGGRVGLQVDITSLKRQQIALEAAQAALADQNEVLERKVAQRTATIAAQAAALESALAEEREVTKAQRRFVAMISHEFRTPLAIIDAAAGRVSRKGRRMDAVWVEDYATHIRGAVRRLVTLIESVLGAAKADAGKMVPKPGEVDLAAMIAEICADQRRLSPGREIAATAEIPDPVTADRGLIYQVLVNLVGNAVKYSPEGAPVTVAARMEQEDAVVAVTDRGVGIPGDELDRMFTRFFRASTASGIAGTGLGLSLAREIARMHGGDITVKSREGKGSTFTLRLRAAGPPVPAAGQGEADAA